MSGEVETVASIHHFSVAGMDLYSGFMDPVVRICGSAGIEVRSGKHAGRQARLSY